MWPHCGPTMAEGFVKHMSRDKKEGTMRRLTSAISLGLLLGLLLVASPALAVGPLLGTNCFGSLTGPTTFVDGSPLVGTPVYNWWMLQGNQTVPARPPDVTGVTGT